MRAAEVQWRGRSWQGGPIRQARVDAVAAVGGAALALGAPEKTIVFDRNACPAGGLEGTETGQDGGLRQPVNDRIGDGNAEAGSRGPEDSRGVRVLGKG